MLEVEQTSKVFCLCADHNMSHTLRRSKRWSLLPLHRRSTATADRKLAARRRPGSKAEAHRCIVAADAGSPSHGSQTNRRGLSLSLTNLYNAPTVRQEGSLTIWRAPLSFAQCEKDGQMRPGALATSRRSGGGEAKCPGTNPSSNSSHTLPRPTHNTVIQEEMLTRTDSMQHCGWQGQRD